MAGDEPELRKKHHRSSEDGAEDGSKRRKHSHRSSSSSSSHRHHHHHHRRHRSSKHDGEIREEDRDPENIQPIDFENSKSRPDDDKEEGEILDEEDTGVANGDLVKKTEESDVESGEIKPGEGALEDWNLNTGDVAPGNTEVIPPENGVVIKSPANRKGDSGGELYDGMDIKETYDDTYIHSGSKTEHSVSDDKNFETGETDSDLVNHRETERKQRHRSSRHSNGDVRHKSRESRRSRRESKSPAERGEIDLSRKDRKTSKRTRTGRSRSPLCTEDFELEKHQNVDDVDTEKRDSVGRISRKYPELVDAERSNPGKPRKSISPECLEDKYASVAHSSYEDIDYRHGRKRSKSGDHVRERRSRSRSYLEDDRLYRKDDVMSYRESSGRMKPSASTDKDKNDFDMQRVVRHDREDLRAHKDSERERERSSSYSRHCRRDETHDSRLARENERERERERERDDDKCRVRVRDRERERSSGYNRHARREDMHGSQEERDRVRDRNRDRDRERERESDVDKDHRRDRGRDWNRGRERDDLDLDRSRDFRRSQYSDQGDYRDKRSRNQHNVSSHRNDNLQDGEDKPKQDEDDQEDYEEKLELKLAAQEEEDIDKIKEESRKRREAILEKYRQQHQEKHQSEDLKADAKDLPTDKPTDKFLPAKLTSVPEGVISSGTDEYKADPMFAVGKSEEVISNGTDQYNVDPMFSVEKSPLQNGPAIQSSLDAGGLGDGTPKSERSDDMFCDDIFGESPAVVRKKGKGEGLQVERNGLNDNWDDSEGYYSYRFGEVLDGRYEVIAAHGKGVFSTVVRAKDLKAGMGEPEEVAIKIIRNNDTMYKAGLDELVILKKLTGADPEDRRHCVRFISSFKYRNHLCLVFESLHMNLREVLKKFGRNIGLKLTAVRAYAKQLFIALKHLRNCGVLHCDIKPDNMVVNEAKTVLKLCDFGNAMFAGKNEITPYLVSRFYRAPEIMLGLEYDHPLDIWSVGCCLYELYSGKVLFPGPSNNDMLRLHMELKGKFPKKMLKKAAFADQHFGNDLTFFATEEDPVTKKAIKRVIVNPTKHRDISAIVTGSPGEDPKMLASFKDLLDKIFILDPDKRMTVSQALNHPFITGK